MEYVTLRLRGGATLTSGAARTLVSYALRRQGRPRWDMMRVELFDGGGETLALARPVRVTAVFADYALPALRRLLRNKNKVT